ncbi:apoptosis-inducing factor 3 isoform X2 [Condylostylus longicornis]|uniref:apoptosis-inducing factor 3 isoform X2 n=1 Tax=Condylostylus longicornis TaxID=2530218 RepID=UPI00244E41B5|nr:apoptosis-inducing factor 3 isoform X2 [Condylostylus longicornis]
MYEHMAQIYTSTLENDDYVEGTICRETDINENEMKQFDLGDNGKVLLIKRNGELSALGTKCTHYGAPLNTGALSDNRVRCPWHGACFNLKTGDIEDFPGLDSIPCYQVKVNINGEVVVRAKRKDLNNNKRIKDMVKKSPSNDTTYVIVGGGPCGGVAVETLRQEGFTGRIVLICKENSLPYDRVKLSKNFGIDLSTLEFRKKEFYEDYSIETLLNVEVKTLNTKTKTVICSNGYSIKYDKILIATGSRAVKAVIPGCDLKNIFTIRNHEDVAEINKLINEKSDVVCLGTGFIGLEAAAYVTGKVKSVTVIGRDVVPLKTVFGELIGERIKKLFVDNNVNMIMNSGIERCFGNDNGISAVQLKDGHTIPCDILIMGTGTVLNTEFIKSSDVVVNRNGSIDTDKYLMSNIQDVYIAGDIANAPIYSAEGKNGVIGHYQLAQYHGKVAATNMAGIKMELKAVPFFWTMLFGKSFRYSGYGKHEETYIEGDLEELNFVAYHLEKNGNVIAITACTSEPVAATYAELQSQGFRLHKDDLQGDPKLWMSKLKI